MRAIIAPAIATMLAACSGSQSAPTLAASQPQPASEQVSPLPRDIAGITVGQIANLPECEKERTYGYTSYKTFPSNVPCWALAINERENLALAPTKSMPKEGNFMADLGSNNVPDGVMPWAEINVIGGKIEEIEIETLGSSHQSQILGLLTSKWGKPNISNIQDLQNGFGAKFQGIEAQWLFDDFTIAFFGIMTKPNEGRIIFRSAIAAAKEKDRENHAPSF